MPPSLQIHTSNRLSVLLRHLLDRLEAEPLPPFEKDVVVVQSQGMSRWLTLRMAERQGIAMSLWTPFPTSLVEFLADAILDQPSSTGAAEDPPKDTASQEKPPRGSKLWQLFALLGPTGPLADTDDITSTYLADDREQLKRFQLAERLAELFDNYQLFRPEMLRRWEEEELPKSQPEAWQARLWRGLVDGPEGPLLQQVRRLQQRLAEPRTTTEWLLARGVPKRLSIFGASTLPPFFLQLMHRLAAFLPVDIYFSSPTFHYWGDLRSEREVVRLTRRLRQLPQPLEETHYETGNPLLASLGRQGRDFFNLLQEVDSDGSAWHELDFDMEPGDSVLATLTDDILHLVDRGLNTDSPSLPLPDADTSLSIHLCHSPMREMEVLRDQLLALFADPQHTDLRPDDILVMVPDIDLYSPYIEAVFQVDHRDSLYLPISIADRKAAHELPAAAAVLRLLDLAKDRLTPTQIFDFLETEAVLRRFDLRLADLPRLRQWIDDLRIRWAMDGAQRNTEFSVPEEAANTWSSGLERLVMGYAVGPIDDLVADIAPWADEGPGEVDLQGHLIALLDALFHQLRRLRGPRRLSRWADDLAACLDHLFAPQGDDDEHALEKVRSSLEDLRKVEKHFDIDEDISLEALQEHLRTKLAEESGLTQFLNGRVTFCALKPMRTIPFKVICIAGLDDGSFPRRQPPRSFDLMQRHPKLGDRSLRDDDRYLFLETLLATQQRLILSYVGFSQKDGAPRAPSVVLSELIEHIDRTFTTEDDRPASAHLIVEHRLHPFHSTYFRDSTLHPQSFSLDDLQASIALQQPRQEVPPFCPLERSQEVPGTILEVPGTSSETPFQEVPGTTLEVPGTSSETPFQEVPGTTLEVPGTSFGGTPIELSIDDLVRFWAHPSRDYCQRTLGLTLWEDRFETDGAEPFEVGSLDGYLLKQEMLERRLQERPQEHLHRRPKQHSERDLMRSRGDLPLAGLGDAAYAGLRRDVDAFVHLIPDHQPVEPPWVELRGETWHLSGQLEGLTRRGLLRYRLANLKGADQRRAWIYHLIWNIARPQINESQIEESLRFIPLETHLIGRNRQLLLKPVNEARRHLEQLIEGLRQGRRTPLPFFDGASHALVVGQLKATEFRQGSRRTPMEAALDAWQGTRRPGSNFTGGDRDDPWVALCFRSRDPLQEPDFATWARHLWHPLLLATEESP